MEPGKRLLPVMIDHIAATDPDRAWISVPRDDLDLAKGFVDITYRQFANAINHAAAWLETVLAVAVAPRGPGVGIAVVRHGGFDTFAYEGPRDFGLLIVTVAAAKIGRKIFLPFPWTRLRNKLLLLDYTRCGAFICDESSRKEIEDILRARPHLRGIVAPPLCDWITEKEAKPVEYQKSWEQAKHDPWIIFHTSGTTGIPRPIVYTHLMMTSVDASKLFPDAGEETQMGCHVNSRVFSTVPIFHLVGMTAALQSTVWLGTTLVLGPMDKPVNAAVAEQVLRYGNPVGLAAPPFLIKDLCRQPESFRYLKSLRFVQWAGAPLDQATGDLISPHVKLAPAFGTTEAGPYFTRVCEAPRDWAYYCFQRGQGIDFEPRSERLFELVFRRQLSAHWQQIFLLHPELDEYRTKDLFQRHPTRSDLWLYSGRTDDMVILANGENLHASNMEAIIIRDPLVQTALIGGQGRNRSFLVLELAKDDDNNADDEHDNSSPRVEGVRQDARLGRVWPAVEAANAICSDSARISKELVLFSSPTKPIPRTAKGSLLRREALALYHDEVEALFARVEPGVAQPETEYSLGFKHARSSAGRWVT
ncbi:MAG: hypothetical protein M1837_006892 [Sclerophora amabilis]|nr:MAG: hypothetical protein M1837_006892 [Sclerophora amabilis]